MRILSFVISIISIYIAAHTAAVAASWNCSNTEMEITCNDGKCVSSDSFTPSSVSFDDKGAVTICAGSGCWEGSGKAWQQNEHLLISAPTLEWNDNTPSKGSFALAYNTNTRIATINGEGFAMPLVCLSDQVEETPQKQVLESSSGSVNREAIFKGCEKIVSEKKSFRALDRGSIKSFKLSSTTFTGNGKDNINIIIDEIERRNYDIDPRKVAYILGTAYRETAGTMRPIHEAMGCKTEQCIHKNVGEYGQPRANGKSYYGRGFSQLTHDRNYKKFSSLLDLKPESALYDNPDMALEPKIAASVLVIGMYDGAFTGKHKLSDHFSSDKEDWNGARKIVNPGSKRAPVTAGYGKLFYECLTGKALIDNGELIK